MKVLAFGEVLWDFIDGEKYFGGAPLNFAAHVINCGAEAAIVTTLGTDRLGDQALEELRKLGVSDQFVQREETRVTGKVMVLLNDGQPTYRIKKDVAYDCIDKAKLNMNEIGHYDAFYFGTLAQRSSMSRTALEYILKRSHFQTIFYDVNLRRDSYTKEIIESSLGYCTVTKMNEEEVITLSKLLYGAQLLPELFASRLFQDYPELTTVLITAGEKGCEVYTRTQKATVPSEPVTVRDTVGAGDAFCAAFLTQYMSSNDPKKAARIGNLVGGFVASQSGAVPPYPDDFKRKISVLSGVV